MIRSAAVLSWLALLASCASRHAGPDFSVSAKSVAASDVAACQASLRAAASTSLRELDADRIRLVSWNAQKNRRGNWYRDLQSLSREKDLVLVQEVSLRQDTVNAMDSSQYWSFAPGYRTAGAVSGVLTISRSQPIAQCTLVSLEPILRTPKATSITEYGLTMTDQTLVVVNLHAVNFSIGLAAFQGQFEQVKQVLETHDGPVILSGDFNTWGKKRTAIVDELASDLGLLPLAFSTDHRVRRFGHPLDHVFVRGLSLLESSTKVVSSSDHNPMIVTLQL